MEQIYCMYAPKAFKKEKLQNFHTKQLLNWNNFRSGREFYAAYRCETCELLDKCYQIQKHNREMVKQELSTRPHILNKKEGKELRRKMAKEKI